MKQPIPIPAPVQGGSIPAPGPVAAKGALSAAIPDQVPASKPSPKKSGKKKIIRMAKLQSDKLCGV